METVSQDISEAKKKVSGNFRIVDDKIVCSFNIEDQSNSKTPYIYYEKIFVKWNDFKEYSDELFKETN